MNAAIERIRAAGEFLPVRMGLEPPVCGTVSTPEGQPMSESITPGPWRACTDPNGVPQLLYSGLIAPIFYSPDNYVAVVSDTADVGDYAECCADAALMAAAPLLKAALEQALEQTEDGLHVSPCDEPDCWVEAALAALAASAPPPTADAGAEDGGL